MAARSHQCAQSKSHDTSCDTPSHLHQRTASFAKPSLLILTLLPSTFSLYDSSPYYRHPQTLGRAIFLSEALSRRPFPGLDSSPCAAMSGPRVRTPLDVVGVRFRVPARKRRLQAVMRGQHTPYDTKGSETHGCMHASPGHFGHGVSVWFAENGAFRQSLSRYVNSKIQATRSFALPLTPIRDTMITISHILDSVGAEFLSKQLSQHDTSRDGFQPLRRHE